MQIAKGKVVSVDYTLTDEAGQVLDSSKGHEPLAYLHGVGQIVPGLERAMEGRSLGESLAVDVEPQDAYGFHDQRLVESVPRDAFKGIADIAPGMQFQASQGDRGHMVTVTEVTPDMVKVDANHPLAGKKLHFDVKIVAVRDATQEELDHGHAHGPHGHPH